MTALEWAAVGLFLMSLVTIMIVGTIVRATVRQAWREFKRHPIRTTAILLAAIRRRPNVPPAPRPVPLDGDAMWLACPLSTWTGNPARCRWRDEPLDPAKGSPFCGPRCRHEAEANHYFPQAKVFVLRRDNYQCAGCGTYRDPQVNHVIPCLGRHNEAGCHHHAAGLNVLCGPGGNACHQQETNRQRAAGQFNRRPA